MTVRLGRRLGLNAGAIERLGLAGLLHDIGKCAIPESILAKPAVLSASERRVMDHHAALGGRIAALLGADAEVVYAVGTHHRTHPQFAAGAIFSLAGRLICVADALVSMMSDRPYCQARSVAEALGELRRCAGTQFDPAVVELTHKLDWAHDQAA